MSNYIYINGFWEGFANKQDGNHIGFFEHIFKNSRLKNFEITNDLNKANVLFESVFSDTLQARKKWKYKIFYSGEYFLNNIHTETNTDNYDVILCNQQSDKNIIDLPLFVYYIHGNNFLNRLVHRPIISAHQIPKKFCCFIVSNSHEWVRNKMFDVISTYKKIDSMGRFKNNMGYRKWSCWQYYARAYQKYAKSKFAY